MLSLYLFDFMGVPLFVVAVFWNFETFFDREGGSSCILLFGTTPGTQENKTRRRPF